MQITQAVTPRACIYEEYHWKTASVDYSSVQNSAPIAWQESNLHLWGVALSSKGKQATSNPSTLSVRPQTVERN